MNVSSRQRCLIRLTYVFSLCAIAIVVARLFWREAPMDRQALSYVEALREARGGDLTAMIPDHELSAMGISRSDAGRIVNNFIVPKLRRAKVSREVRAEVQGGGVSGVAFYVVESRSGRPVELAAIVEKYDKGSFRSLKLLLYDAWLFEYLQEVDPKSMQNVTAKAIRWGLEKDMTELKSFGVTRLAQEGYGKPARSLEETLKRAKRATRS